MTFRGWCLDEKVLKGRVVSFARARGKKLSRLMEKEKGPYDARGGERGAAREAVCPGKRGRRETLVLRRKKGRSRALFKGVVGTGSLFKFRE